MHSARDPAFDLQGRVAVITGSSRGIGRSIAEHLARAGARVVISSRKADACEATAAAIVEAGGEAIAVPANVSSRGQLDALVDATLDRWGRIDVLVGNAASNPYYGPLAGLTDDAFAKIMHNNVLANIHLVNRVAPQMAARRDGAIILVSSIGGLRGDGLLGAYNISKAADMQLVRNLAVEWGKHNIRVNAIAPGLIRTDFARALWENPKLSARLEAAAPLGRIGEPDDIGGLAVLLSARAGAYITGQVLVADGGLMAANVW
ncbi:MAG: SDR family oxidoreductase [Myxococcales bacterium]|nr:SDR family oxidoreductase [Myxococcales bacterium]